MERVDRIAIVVKPKDPLLAWARALDGKSPTIDELLLSDLGTVYLATVADAYRPEQVLRQHFLAIFEKELSSWHQDAATWPKQRTYWMFQEWFDVQVVGLVYDLPVPKRPSRTLTRRSRPDDPRSQP